MYAKIFSRIVESSLMETPLEVRYTFVFLLAIADPSGFVIGTDVAIARRLNMPVPEFRRCIDVLMRPDPDSNSKECDGRRLVESDVERGYRIVNYVTYRDLRNAEERREYMREYMRRRRALTGVNSVSADVSTLAEEEESEGSKKKEEDGSSRFTPEVQSFIANLVASGEYADAEGEFFRMRVTPRTVSHAKNIIAKYPLKRKIVHPMSPSYDETFK